MPERPEIQTATVQIANASAGKSPGAVHGWDSNPPIKKRLLWDELGIEPSYPTIHQGIAAVLDECVAFQWIHPVADRLG